MRLPHRRMVHEAEPVGVGVEQQGVVLRRVRQHGGPELRRVEHRGQLRDPCGGHTTIVLDSRSASPPFRGDQHHAVGRVCPVDRRGRGVLEHRDAPDVIGIQKVERVAASGEPAARAGAERHAVEDVQRLAAGVDRRLPADADREAAPGLVVVDDLHARDLVRDELLRAGDSAGIEIRRVDLRLGAGDVAGQLLPVAGDHDFRQADSLGGQSEIDDDRVIPRDRDGLRRRGVPDQPRPHGVRACRYPGDEVAPVQRRPRVAAPDRDYDARERLLRCAVGDASADRAGGLLCAQRRYPYHCQERGDDVASSSHTRPLERWGLQAPPADRGLGARGTFRFAGANVARNLSGVKHGADGEPDPDRPCIDRDTRLGG